VVFLCTNRLSVLDAALRRRAAIVEEFKRPDEHERIALLRQDLEGLKLTNPQLAELATAMGPKAHQPGWTYSDIRTRLYPSAMAKAFPDKPLTFEFLLSSAHELAPSPIMEDK